MDKAHLKAILMALMCPLGANLKVQPHTLDTLEDNADELIRRAGLKTNPKKK